MNCAELRSFCRGCMALRSFEDNVCKEPSVVCVLFKRCARRFFSEDLENTRSGVEYLKKETNNYNKCYLFRPGGHPLNTRSGVKYGFGPFCYFCMFYRRFPRSFGPPCGTRWGDFRPLFLFGTLLGRSNGGSCGGSVLTPFFISNFDQNCTIGKSKT